MPHDKQGVRERFEKQVPGYYLDEGKPIMVQQEDAWKFLESEIDKAREEERKRIEEVFKKEVPPHGLTLEDGIWLKRLLNRAFNHKQ